MKGGEEELHFSEYIEAMALPSSGSAAGITPHSNEVEDAVNKCGDGAHMSCCNKINKNEGISQNNIGVLSNVLGAIGSEGLGLGQGCTQLVWQQATLCWQFFLRKSVRPAAPRTARWSVSRFSSWSRSDHSPETGMSS
jgi:hypothetical protein